MKEKSLFIEFMGDSPTVRVLDYLMTERDLDFSISDVAIGRTTLYRIWSELLKKEIILPTRIIGKSKLHKLNKENPKIQKIIELDDMICLEALRKKAEEQKVKMIA